METPLTDSRKWIIEPEFSVNALQPLNLGARFHRPGEQHWSAFADLGFLWVPFGRADPLSSAESFGIHTGLRYAPRQELPYFGSLSVGYRYLGASVNQSSFATVDGSKPIDLVQASLSTFYVEIAVGSNWKVNRWLELGFDVGAQVPVLGWGSLNPMNTKTGAQSSNTSSLAVDPTALGRVAGLIIPEITLIRLTLQMQ